MTLLRRSSVTSAEGYTFSRKPPPRVFETSRTAESTWPVSELSVSVIRTEWRFRSGVLRFRVLRRGSWFVFIRLAGFVCWNPPFGSLLAQVEESRFGFPVFAQIAHFRCLDGAAAAAARVQGLECGGGSGAFVGPSFAIDQDFGLGTLG